MTFLFTTFTKVDLRLLFEEIHLEVTKFLLCMCVCIKNKNIEETKEWQGKKSFSSFRGDGMRKSKLSNLSAYLPVIFQVLQIIFLDSWPLTCVYKRLDQTFVVHFEEKQFNANIMTCHDQI